MWLLVCMFIDKVEVSCGSKSCCQLGRVRTFAHRLLSSRTSPPTTLLTCNDEEAIDLATDRVLDSVQTYLLNLHTTHSILIDSLQGSVIDQIDASMSRARHRTM